MSLLDYYYEYKFDLLTTAIGAFLGFMSALLVFWIANQHSKSIDNKKNLELARNHSARLIRILDKIVKDGKEQMKQLKIYTNEQKGSPMKLVSFRYSPTNDFQRLVQSDSVDLFSAYMLLESNNTKRIEEYRQLFSEADFVNKFFIELFQEIKRMSDVRALYINKVRDDLVFIATKINGLSQKYNDPICSKEFKNLFELYLNLKEKAKSDIGIYDSEFLNSLENKLSLLKDDNLKIEFHRVIISIKNSYGDMKIQSIQHLESINNEENLNNINNGFIYFEKISKSLNKL